MEERAVFVGIIRQGEDERKVKEYLDELEFLADTAGVAGDKKFVQKLDKPEKATYIRSGKLDEIAAYCEENEIKYVIFDDELTAMQQRNVEKVIKTSSVIDRTSLILEIFSQRAHTSDAKMQVELARYNYMLPRLAGMWTHLERQRGGIGTRGGMGESQIEVDRRIVRERIARLKEQLKKVDKQMATQRGNRGSLVRLSLVGYTNVGKSTLM
ncbi:MAG: GTPase HflX, partial [Bacteroidales bacterium]|nr:GTPase HflX [Bacteroidales bacterium]